MSRARLSITLVVVTLARTAAAAPCEDVSALRADLEQEAARADRWNLAWQIGFTALAAGQLGVAASGVTSHDRTEALWVGGAKSSIGALGHWLSPLRIEVPPATGDACADRAALRAVAERAARDERRAFWAGHIGGLALNIVGTVVVAERTSLGNGLLAFATGYSTSLLSTYTMPRASWHRTRDLTWTAQLVTGDGQYTIAVTGSF